MKRNAIQVISLAAAMLPSLLLAQGGPRPAGAPATGPQPVGAPMGNRTSGAVRQTVSTARVATTAEITATMQILARTDVRKELALTADQLDALAGIATNAASIGATEDAVRSQVAQVLSAAQTKRLTELLIQYLGYGSLGLSDVRAKLDLSADQEARIADILTSLAQAKATLKTAASSTAAYARGVAQLKAQAGTQLAGVLTAEQDKALRALAGRTLGS